MFSARVEQKAGSGFNHRSSSQGTQQLADDRKLLPEFCPVEWDQCVMVQRNGHAFIPELGDDLKRVFQPVMGKAVGVVTETQRSHGTDSRNSISGTRDRSSCSSPMMRDMVVLGQPLQAPIS